MTTKPRETQIEDLIQRWRDRSENSILHLALREAADELSALLREEAPAKSGCQHMYSSGRTCGRHAGDAVHVSDAIDCGDLSVFNTHRYVAPPEGWPNDWAKRLLAPKAGEE